jgi:hypothetical protein
LLISKAFKYSLGEGEIIIGWPRGDRLADGRAVFLFNDEPGGLFRLGLRGRRPEAGSDQKDGEHTHGKVSVP